MIQIHKLIFLVIMELLTIAPLYYGLNSKTKKKLTSEQVCRLILLSGAILRIFYIMYSPAQDRQHDVFQVLKNGHFDYIEYLLENKHLPDFSPKNKWQFYQPPLHHIICAVFIGLIQKIGISDRITQIELLQTLPCAYSIIFNIIAYKTLKNMKLKEVSIETSLLFITFYPMLIILSGSLNNDMLSSLFGMLAIYCTINWIETKKISDIIKIALSIGLGMMTKLSVGLLAPSIAAVFLYVLIKNNKIYKKLITQFFTFGLICIPIGMFWYVRNYIKFKIPLNYIPSPVKTDPEPITETYLKRFLDFTIETPFVQMINDNINCMRNDVNPLILLCKTAMFDEVVSDTGTLKNIAILLFTVCLLITILFTILFFYIMFKRNSIKHEYKMLITLISVVIIINELIFCYNYPFICTANMRYCIPLIFVQGFIIASVQDQPENKIINSTIKNLITVFCILSITYHSLLMFTISIV